MATIARTDLRRRRRALTENAAQLIAISIAVLFFAPLSLGVPIGAYLFGSEIASGGLETPVEWMRIAVVYIWLMVAAFVGYRAYATALRPDQLDGLLTTVSHRELLGGLVLAEVVLWGVPAGLLGVLTALAFAAGAGSILAVPALLLTLGLTFATALTAGFFVALGVMNTGVRSALIARLRTAMIVAASLAYFAVLMTQNFEAILDPAFHVLEPTPVGWYGDLALLGTTSDASLGRGIGALVTSIGVLLVGSVSLPWLAAWLWYADGVHVEHESSAATQTETRESRLTGYLPRPMVGVALVDWKRARRKPIMLSFALYPLVLLINPVASVFQTGSVGGSFPLWIVLCGAWLTGAVFTLNVVGNEGAVLTTTLLSQFPGRALVGGHVVAGALVGVPATIMATVGLGLASPHTPVAVATLTVSAVVLTACAGPIATGIGSVLPRFEAVSVSRSTNAIVPSKLAFAVYSLALSVIAAPTLLGHSGIVGDALASLVGASTLVVALAGTGLTTVLAVPTAILSARHAIDAVEAYHFD